MSGSDVRLGALRLAHPVFNAAGPWSVTSKQLKDLADSDAAAVATKSFSVVPWPGNPAPNLHRSEHYAINSLGLKNQGVDYFIDAATQLNGAKPKIANVVGKESSEYVELVRKLNTSPFDAVELNLSCPNVVTKEAMGYSLAAVKELLIEVMRLSKLPIGVKLPAYTSRADLKAMAELLRAQKVNHVVLINTFPIAAAINGDGRPAIVPNDGVGGLSGPALKPIAMAHVMLFRQFSDGRVPIVGVGGIRTRIDVDDYLAAGAVAVQVGTAILHQGLDIFTVLKQPSAGRSRG